MKTLILVLVALALTLAPVAAAGNPKATPTPVPGQPKIASPEEAKAAIAAVKEAEEEKELLAAIKRLGEVYYPKKPLSTVAFALSIVMDEKRSMEARAGAAAVLGKFHDKSVVPALSKYVINPNVKREVPLSSAIATALGEIGDPGAISALERLATYKETPVAVASARALGKVKHKKAIEELIKILDVTEDPDDASSSRQKRYAQIAAAARLSLVALTKESFFSATEYRKWWKENEKDFKFEPPKVTPTPAPAAKR